MAVNAIKLPTNSPQALFHREVDSYYWLRPWRTKGQRGALAAAVVCVSNEGGLAAATTHVRDSGLIPCRDD